MFKILTDMVDNALSVVTGPLFGEIPTQRQVAKLISDGLSVAAIAASFGVAEDVISSMIDGEHHG